MSKAEEWVAIDLTHDDQKIYRGVKIRYPLRHDPKNHYDYFLAESRIDPDYYQLICIAPFQKAGSLFSIIKKDKSNDFYLMGKEFKRMLTDSEVTVLVCLEW